jgi:hypothetical protein
MALHCLDPTGCRCCCCCCCSLRCQLTPAVLKVALQAPSSVARVVIDWETAHCDNYAVTVTSSHHGGIRNLTCRQGCSSPDASVCDGDAAAGGGWVLLSDAAQADVHRVGLRTVACDTTS